jgi:Cu-processing system permease protein
MKTPTVVEIARQEFVINVRNRWMLIFAGVFSALVLAIAYVGIMAEGFSGMQGFTRTSASILNLVLYIVPLVALTMGTLSFTGDTGSTELLFSQPVSRAEVLLGKLLGVFLSMTLSMLSGFVLAGVVMIVGSGTEGIFRYLPFVGFSIVLSLIFLGLSLVTATVSRRKARAFGLSLFLWFFFVLFYDLLAIGGTLLLNGQSANTFLFVSLFGNPVDMVRVASLITLDNITLFGASGAAMLRFLGGPVASVLFLVAGLLLWVCCPLLLSHRLIRKQDI